MLQERDDEEQPLRCMANYYDYGPASSTTSNTIARPTTFASRSVPDRMVNYTDIRFDRTRTGYHALQEATRAPQKRKEVHVDLRSTTSPSESTNGHQRSLIAVGEDAPSTKRYTRRSSTFEASRSLSKLDAVVEEVDQLDESDAPTHQIDHQPPSLSTRSSFETEANTTDNPYWKFRKAMRAANEGYQERVQGSRFYGWRMGVLLGTCTSMFVFICNVALLIIGAKTKAGYDRDGIATLMEGDETTISRWNTVCHIFINVLSTILLSASNYTMQILNAPTRAELDSAHRRGKWLDIGLLSVHNLKTISPKRACLCLVLAASSLPLHLFYNAAIFKIITMSDYSVMFLDRNSTMLNGTSGLSNHWIDSVRLETSQWMAVYNRPEVSRYSDLYLVVDQISFDTQVNFGTNVNYTIQDYLPLSLNSTYFINLKNKKPSREGWFSFATWDGLWFGHEPPTSLHVVEGWTLDSGRNSRMQISLYFMVVVLAFNFFKLVIMVGVLLIDTSDEYLVTLGDAAASYLKYPEDLTRGRSTLELDQIFSSFDLAQDADCSTSMWQPRRRRYCSSVGYDKAWSAIIAGSCLVIVLVVFPSTVDVLPDLHSGMWSWGSSSSGAVSFGAKGASAKATIWNAWLSNMPQVLLSLCYLNLNTICTSMASAAEWNHLASSRKGLRVTKPRGEQRSTYFLQLPYKWGVPLVITSGGLHWLLSQAFFLARIDFYDLDGDLERWTSACGISFSALVAFCCVCLLLVLAVRWVGRRHMMPRLPLAENCSLMISAACHPAPDEIDPHLAKVKWGVVTDTGRCSLSSKHVKQPEVGKSYG